MTDATILFPVQYCFLKQAIREVCQTALYGRFDLGYRQNQMTILNSAIKCHANANLLS